MVTKIIWCLSCLNRQRIIMKVKEERAKKKISGRINHLHMWCGALTQLNFQLETIFITDFFFSSPKKSDLIDLKEVGPRLNFLPIHSMRSLISLRYALFSIYLFAMISRWLLIWTLLIFFSLHSTQSFFQFIFISSMKRLCFLKPSWTTQITYKSLLTQWYK